MTIITEAKAQTATTPITQIPSVSTLVLGRDGDWWDKALLWSLAAVAVTAFAVLVATIGQIISHKREADASRFELDAYKVAVEGKVAEAKTEGIAAGRVAADAVARAAEANERAEAERLERVKLESRLAGRRLSPEQTKTLIEVLSRASATLPGLEIIRLGDREAFVYASDIIGAAMVSGIRVQTAEIGTSSPPQYGLLIEDTPDRSLGIIMAAAGVEIARQIKTARSVPLLFVGLKPPY